jgi:Ankyrin repeats (many copies)/Putative peptidoglycan binding domain/Ankyrin repeat
VANCRVPLRIVILVALGSPLAFGQNTPVIDAVHKGHAVGHEQDGVNAIREALAAGGNVTERDKAGWTPLMHAALECRADEMKLLLDKGANPKLRGNAVEGGSFTESGLDPMLLAAGCFISRRRAQLAPERHMPEGYAVYELAAAGKMVRELLSRGTDVNASDVHGRTPLMMAAMHAWPDVVRALLNAHANIHARDRAGHTVLDFVDPAETQVLAILNKAGAPPGSGHSARTVCDAQRALDKLGYDMPIADCIDGKGQFANTVRRYQREHALPITGELDTPTLKALGVRP